MLGVINYFNLNAGFYSFLLCSLTVCISIAVAVVQYRQNKKMEGIQNKIDERDEKRHKEYIDALAYSFISEYSDILEFLPLCFIASMYDRGYGYRNGMYNKFCSLSLEVQNRVLEIREINIKRIEVEDIYDICLEKLKECIHKNKLDLGESLYYEGGKYFHRTLLRYGNEKPYSFKEGRKYLTDILGESFRVGGIELPIDIIEEELNFRNCEEKKACLIASEIAKYIAIYKNHGFREVHSPDMTESGRLVYMEDIFLAALFEIYYNLVLDDCDITL